MAQIRTALALYYFDNESYPTCGIFDENEVDFGADVGAGEDNGSQCYLDTLGPDLTIGTRPIMQKLPEDPRNKTNDPVIDPVYIYRYVSDGEQYALVYTLEDISDGEQVIRGW